MKSEADKSFATNTTIDQPLPFTREQCEKLFAAVLVHDDIYPNATLPDEIHLNYSQAQLNQCYQLCLQLWELGVQRQTLKALIFKIYRQHQLDPAEQEVYKDIRAKFKHLRFAYVTCGENHTYPNLFSNLTRKMGKFQDAFKNKKYSNMKWAVNRLRILLTPFVYRFITREVEHFKASSTETFQHYIHSEIDFIRLHLKQSEVTGKEFHETRKVISRQVALYDNLKVLYPSQYHNKISEYLSTINGMMGSFHDDLIITKFADPEKYFEDTFPIPAEIKVRLESYTQKFQLMKSTEH
ncbi:hypothetical protein [Psychromonas sp. MME2]|uniref:hypothetical protein n=1 Tax=unclassified Psychromonas TaxID=2614957 RepID=UPI00339D1235